MAMTRPDRSDRAAAFLALAMILFAAHSALVAHGQCLEQYGAGEAYMPILEALERLCSASADRDLTSLVADLA